MLDYCGSLYSYSLSIAISILEPRGVAEGYLTRALGQSSASTTTIARLLIIGVNIFLLLS